MRLNQGVHILARGTKDIPIEKLYELYLKYDKATSSDESVEDQNDDLKIPMLSYERVNRSIPASIVLCKETVKE